MSGRSIGGSLLRKVVLR